MHRPRGAPLLILLTLSLAVAGCSSSKSDSTTTTGDGVTVPSGSGVTVNIEVSDTAGTGAAMTLVPDQVSAPAGDVTFAVKNTGTIEHEVVVLKTDVAFDQLPVGGTEPDRIDESTSAGETGDPPLKAGESRSFTLTGLAAGKYVLVCNIAKHYGLGMRIAFTVT